MIGASPFLNLSSQLAANSTLYLAKCNAVALFVATYPTACDYVEDVFQAADETIDFDAPFTGKALAEWIDCIKLRYNEIRKEKLSDSA